MATTLLLVGLWGRAVVHDQPTIQASARSVVNAEIASDRIYSWIEDAVMASGDVDPETAEQVVSELADHPEIEIALESLVDQFVGALFVHEGDAATLELAETLGPVVPLISATLAQHDESIDTEVLTAALAQAEDVDLETGDAATVARIVNDARGVLSVIVVLALFALVLTGASAIWLSSSRLAMVRTLATRIVLSALSFTVLFRTGAWVLDPSGGGSPIASGSAILLGSNTHVFGLVGALSAAVALVVAWYVWRTRPAAGRGSDPLESDEDTRELASI